MKPSCNVATLIERFFTERLMPYFTNWVRFLRFSGRLIAINHWI
jgi:hypothetical protein